MNRDQQLREVHRLAHDAERAWTINPFAAVDNFLDGVGQLEAVNLEEAKQILKARVESTSA